MIFANRSVRALVRTWSDRVQALFATLPLGSLPARRIVQQFREAGAVTARAAQPFRARSRADEDAFIYLLRLGAIREPAPGRYYLDEGSLDAVRRQGRLPWW
jgi:hypothetical protein